MAESESLPSPPFIHVSKLNNFRTIGTHKSAIDGRLTRPDFVYRCGAPTGTDSQTESTLNQLNITTFYDLRSEREIENLSSRMPITNYTGIKRVFNPVFEDRDYSPAALANRLAAYAETGTAGFVRAYAEILDEGKNAYIVIFSHVRDRPQDPFVVHCTAGKDRTGVAVALMLSLVGVPDEEIADEYHLTEAGMREVSEKLVPLLLENPAYGGDADTVRRTLGARRESMLGSLVMLREKYGGAEGYLRGHLGFGDGDVAKIKENLLQK